MILLNNIVIKNKVKKIAAPFRLIWGYWYDYRRFAKSTFDFNRNNLSQDNIRAEIAFEYHAIEKGLSHINLRFGFGKTRVQRLLYLLNLWIERDYSLDDSRFNTGIAVLKEYVSVHKKNNYSLGEIENQIIDIIDKASVSSNILGGAFEISSDKLLDERFSNFEKFSHARRSIRNYGEELIDEEIIIKAVDLAQNAPSVCNRQTTKVYAITSQEIIKKCLEIQNGIQGMAENISALLLITSDNQYFGNLNERNQSFVDGGIYAMNLLYALEYYGVATCSLNANINTKGMEKLRAILDIPSSQDFIMFISCGSYPEIVKFPVSNRDKSFEVLKIIG